MTPVPTAPSGTFTFRDGIWYFTPAPTAAKPPRA